MNVVMKSVLQRMLSSQQSQRHRVLLGQPAEQQVFAQGPSLDVGIWMT